MSFSPIPPQLAGRAASGRKLIMRHGWGLDNPSFRQMSTSPECAARYFDIVGDIDVTNLPAEVKAPTLVMHVRGDLMVPFEAGRQLAAGIPGARFVALQGQNHMFLEDEPASDRFFHEVRLFLRQ